MGSTGGGHFENRRSSCSHGCLHILTLLTGLPKHILTLQCQASCAQCAFKIQGGWVLNAQAAYMARVTICRSMTPWSNSCHGDCKDLFWILDDVAYSQWIEWWKWLQNQKKYHVVTLIGRFSNKGLLSGLKILGDIALGQRGSDKDLCYQGSGLGRVQKHRVRSAAGQRWTLRLWPRLMQARLTCLWKKPQSFCTFRFTFENIFAWQSMQRETQTTHWFPFTPWFRLLWRNLAVLTNVLQQRIRLLQVLSWKKTTEQSFVTGLCLMGF